jgi:hypothetical protein
MVTHKTRKGYHLCTLCKKAKVPISRDVCPFCAAADPGLKWRTIYDRDAGIGEIPRNLVANHGKKT